MNDFAALHRPGDPLLLPNAWDFASAAALARAGHRVLGTTSLGVAVAAGLPDAAGLARAETVALAHRLRPLPCLVTVDIEAGFGDPAGVAAELAALGVVGVNLEDSRPDGALAPIAEQQQAIRAVKRAAPDLFLNARTDTHWLREPTGLTETLDRLHAYDEAGADGVFVPGTLSDNDIGTLVREAQRPLNVLFQPARQPVARLAALGVARISTGSLLFRAAVAATVAAAQAFRDGSPLPAALPAYAEVAALVE